MHHDPSGPAASTQLVLPGSVTETGLSLRADLTFDEWQEAGVLLGRIGRACQWWMGDWLNYGERKYGEKYAQAINVTGYEYGTVANAAWVASRVEPSRRREDLSWSHHQEIAPLPPAEQDRWLDQAIAHNMSVSDLRREKRRPQLPAPALPAGTFDVIYADPPWQYDWTRSESRAIENQYPTLELDEIQAVDVPAADDAVLFLWATSPKLDQALEVLAAWGFTYKTCMVWVKDKIGMGYYARQQHELLLIAGRGEAPIPDTDVRPSSVVEAPRGRHSEKPERFYDLIESMYPGRHWLELFARRNRAGWTAWGNEVEAAA